MITDSTLNKLLRMQESTTNCTRLCSEIDNILNNYNSNVPLDQLRGFITSFRYILAELFIPLELENGKNSYKIAIEESRKSEYNKTLILINKESYKALLDLMITEKDVIKQIDFSNKTEALNKLDNIRAISIVLAVLYDFDICIIQSETFEINYYIQKCIKYISDRNLDTEICINYIFCIKHVCTRFNPDLDETFDENFKQTLDTLPDYGPTRDNIHKLYCIKTYGYIRQDANKLFDYAMKAYEKGLEIEDIADAEKIYERILNGHGAIKSMRFEAIPSYETISQTVENAVLDMGFIKGDKSSGSSRLLMNIYKIDTPTHIPYGWVD